MWMKKPTEIKKWSISYQNTQHLFCSNKILVQNIIAPGIKRQVCPVVKQPILGVGRALPALHSGIKENKQEAMLSRFAALPSATASRTQVAVSSYHHKQR